MEYTLYRAISHLLNIVDSGHIPIRRHGLSHVETYEITADELKRIEQEGSDVGFDFQIGQFCLTLAASFLIGLILSPPPDDHPKTFVVFTVLVVVGFLMGIIFGIKWFVSRRSFSFTIREIRERQVGPIGEEGRELKPSELDQIPSTEPGGQQ